MRTSSPDRMRKDIPGQASLGAQLHGPEGRIRTVRRMRLLRLHHLQGKSRRRRDRRCFQQQGRGDRGTEGSYPSPRSPQEWKVYIIDEVHALYFRIQRPAEDSPRNPVLRRVHPRHLNPRKFLQPRSRYRHPLQEDQRPGYPRQADRSRGKGEKVKWEEKLYGESPAVRRSPGDAVS